MKVTTILMKLKFVLNLCEKGHLPAEAGIWVKSTIDAVRQIQSAMDRMEHDGMTVPSEGQTLTLKNIDAAVMKWLGPDELDRLFDLVSLFDDYCGNVENLLHYDWSHTKNLLSPTYLDEFISPSGTFLFPVVKDEYNDWGSRGCLLNSYRNLMKEWVS